MRLESDQIKTAVVIGVLVLGFGLGLWLPQNRAKARLQDRIDKARKELTLEPVGVRELGDLATEVHHLETAVNGSQQVVPESGELADLLRSLSHRLEAEKTVQQEVQTQPIIHAAEYSVIPIKLNFGGTFAGTYDFVRHIEAMRRLVRIDVLELRGDPASPTDPLSVHVELSAFFTTPQEAAP